MDPITRSITIDRPREEVFEYLADIANHPEFSDHFLKEWRLTRVESPDSSGKRRCSPRWSVGGWWSLPDGGTVTNVAA